MFAPAGMTEVRPALKTLRSALPWLVRRNNAGARRRLKLCNRMSRRLLRPTAPSDAVR